MINRSLLLQCAVVGAGIVASVILIGCGQSAPTDGTAREAWVAKSSYYTKVQPGELVDFKKINGVSGEFGGVKTYEYQYEASLRCTKDWNWGAGAVDPWKCKEGEIVKVRGTLNFRKTENGWSVI